MKKLTTFIVICLLLISVNHANADLNLNNVEGSWSGTVGGTSVNYPIDIPIGYGNGLEDQVRWGTSTGEGQSGLGFTGVVSSVDPDGAGPLVPMSPVSITLGTAFEIGQLQHFNAPIAGGSAASSTNLGISMTIANGGSDSEIFAFTFGINETPNTGDPDESADIISFSVPSALETITINSQEYTLWLLGFGDAPGSLADEFVSYEGDTNATKLWGQIAPVPVPGAFLLGMLGLSVAGVKLRKHA